MREHIGEMVSGSPDQCRSGAPFLCQNGVTARREKGCRQAGGTGADHNKIGA